MSLWVCRNKDYSYAGLTAPYNPFMCPNCKDETMIETSTCPHGLEVERCARCNRKDLDVTAEGGIQSKLIHRPSLLPPRACMLVSTILGVKAKEYGEWNWKKIPPKDHLDHVMNHVFQHVAGDRSEFHLGNVACRSLFLLEKFLDNQTLTTEGPSQAFDGYDLSYLGVKWEDFV